MKKRFNILTIALVAVVVLNIVGNLVYYGIAIADVFANYTREDAMAHKAWEKTYNEKYLLMVNMLPTDIWNNKQTILNSKTGEKMSAEIVQCAVSVDRTPLTSTLEVVTYCMSAVLLLLGVFILLYSIRFICKINRAEIFTLQNVSFLRKLGWLLIVSFGCTLVIKVLDNYVAMQYVAMDGHVISLFDVFEDSSVIIGFFSLIMAEVFAMGLRQREELDLTV